MLHGNTACSHVPHLSGLRFSASADGQARTELPLDRYRYGHTTVWQMVALYKPAHPPAPHKRRLNPDERPRHATASRQVWFADVRYLAKIEGTGSTASPCLTAIAGHLWE